jgi:hypothetical protein
MASTKLSKTLGTPTNNIKWTWSTWIKRSKITAAVQRIFYALNGSNYTTIQFDDEYRLQWFNQIGGATDMQLITSRKFRDSSAWMHLVFVYDSANATAADRQIIYVNGVRETAFAQENTAGSSVTTAINQAVSHEIGAGSGSYYDGSMTHVNFIDGTAYPATAFGEVDSTSGIWTAKTTPSVTYGNNGFFLKMENASAMGTDSSGESNTFTVSGSLTKNQDTPNNNFATFNPLRPNGISQTYSNGNNTVIRTGTGGQMNGTQGVTSGKWYYECLIDDYWQYLGWTALSLNTSQTAACSASGSGFYGLYSSASALTTYANGSGTSQGSYTPMASGQIWGIAFDADNAKMYFSVNGVWENSSDPANQTNPAMSSIPVTDFLVPAIGQGTGSRSSTIKMNFGNGYFGTTAVSSAGTNASGNGIFEYDVPTGYTALSTEGLNS